MGIEPLPGAAENLHPGVAALEASGESHFDPVRFRYIKALAGRSLQANEPVAALVAARAFAALQEYRSRLSRERAEMASLVEQLAGQETEYAQRMRELFAAHDFRAIRRMAARRPDTAVGGKLAALVGRLDGRPASADHEPGALAFNELLRNQEEDALKSLCGDVTGGETGPAPAAGELKATRLFRDARQRQHAAKRVSRALVEAPADSGPLNPQKLAVRSLEAMHELSPAYLGRLIAYLDTLFWLERAGENRKS